jgi:hypothetical protein
LVFDTPDDLRTGQKQMLKKTLTYGSVAFLVWFVAFRPDSAAKVARGLGGLIAHVGTGFGDFFTRLVA